MIYPQDFEIKSGFNKIRDLVTENCLSPQGRNLAASMGFSDKRETVELLLSETSEFQYLLQFDEPFPSENWFDMERVLVKLKIEGTFPEVSELFDLKRSLETLRLVFSYFKKRDESIYPCLKIKCAAIKHYPYVSDLAEKITDRHGHIKDNASPALREIRSNISEKSQQVSRRLNAILKKAQADGITEAGANVSLRNGRGVIPVNASAKRKISGLIHDQSATGKTFFIEPAEIVELNNEILDLEFEERREIVKILTAFADSVRPYLDDLLISNAFLGEIDFIKAKALLGRTLGSVKPAIVEGPVIAWRKAVHPLLWLSFRKTDGRKVVPLDISIDEKNRIILISGPNAGGKSVCLKTVGLLQYMLQCGLTIPVGEGSVSGLFKNIFIDIGDEQSIENDLSTYSSHLMNMKYFLKYGGKSTLVLIDEFGAGTEPSIGGSIAEAILGEMCSSGLSGVITTHYTNLKHFASVTEGIVNGAMAFDSHLMQPLFQLFIGKPGSSFAFEIARKIGLPEEILARAAEKAGKGNVIFDKNLRDIARDKRYWENKRMNIRQHEKKLEDLIAGYEKEIAEAKQLRKEIINTARTQAKSLLDNSNKLIENTVREIREAQAEREKTLELRKKVEEFKSEVAESFSEKKTESEANAENLKRAAQKIGKLPSDKTPKPEKHLLAPLKEGDPVRLGETNATGEVIKIEGDFVIIESGALRLKISKEKVEKISKAEFRKSQHRPRSGVVTDDTVNERKRSFHPEIDIRGVRGEEAIVRVQDLLDTAIVLQHKNLRILHGKGNGILRELIRNYLAASGVVRKYHDEHVELGGSGITVVELDL
jgi:DNA mismatch repair protein MutS2